MTTPRSDQIDLSATSFYHCMARCVRQSFLCGYDFATSKDFSHRREWILERIKTLANIFYIDVCAYAIMSNHYHLVLHVDTLRAQKSSLDDLLYRWHLLFPSHATKLQKTIDCPHTHKDSTTKIKTMLQARLADISWYMRSLNEVIARMANKEDNCKGRFWEGRFKSQALLDEGALLSAMAYVDLNPIHAGISKTPESSDFTSIQERIRHYHEAIKSKTKDVEAISSQPSDLMAFSLFKNKGSNKECIDFSLKDYLSLVDETGRILREDKKGSISESFAPILERVQLSLDGWLNMVQGIETHFHYAIGNASLLKEYMPSFLNRRSKCLHFAEECYKPLAA